MSYFDLAGGAHAFPPSVHGTITKINDQKVHNDPNKRIHPLDTFVPVKKKRMRLPIIGRTR